MLACLTAALLAGAVWFFSIRADSLAGTIIGMSVMVPLALMFGWFLYLQGRSTVTLSTDALTLDVPWYGKTIKRSDLRVEDARIVNSDDEEWGLKWRTNGIGLPGYSVGWFSTKGGHKVLAAKTSSATVLLPTINSYSLLVTLSDTEGFLKSLQEVDKETPQSR